ncbi:MAG: RNA 2',3'-cyclic phosphodiesterase [Polyangiales bacterium]
MRAFFAIDLPKAAVDGAVDSIVTLETALSRGVAFTKREQIHVTLQFLGDLEEDRAARAVAIASELVFAPFPLTIAGTGAFPDRDHPRVLFLGLRETGPLSALAEALGERLRAEGFVLDERPYHPHVTLARIKKRSAMRAAAEALSKLEFPPLEIVVDRFVLFESRGGVYERRAEFRLRPG